MLVSLIVFGKEIGMDFLSNLSFDKLGEILSYQPTAPMLLCSRSSASCIGSIDLCDIVFPLFLLQKQWRLVRVVGVHGNFRFPHCPSHEPDRRRQP